MQGGELRGFRGGRRCPGWFENYWAITKPGYGGCLEVMLTFWEAMMEGSCMRLWRDGLYDGGNE